MTVFYTYMAKILTNHWLSITLSLLLFVTLFLLWMFDFIEFPKSPFNDP
jgi:hypothetical protein